MKTFLEYMTEQEAMGPPKPFGHETRMKLKAQGLYAPEPVSVDTRGANSPFADPSVQSYSPSGSMKKSIPVQTNPMVGKERPYISDTELKMADINRKIKAGMDKVDADLAAIRKRNSTTVTTDKPLVSKNDAVKKALAAKGYDETGRKISKPIGLTTVATRPDTPTPLVKAKPATTAPIPKARPEGLVKKQTFKQVFAANRAAGKETFIYNGKTYTTKLKKR